MTEIQVRCSGCSKALTIQAYSAGLSDVAVYTCDRDSTVLTLPIQGNMLDIAFGGKRPQGVWTVEDERKIESLLMPCPCGGSFRHDVSAECPNCGEPLSTEGHSQSTYFVVGKQIDGEKQNPFEDETMQKVWVKWREDLEARVFYRKVTDDIDPLLEDALSGKAEFDFSQFPPGSHSDKEAIFAWTLYYFRDRSPFPLELFLYCYDAINKDVPTAGEVVWAFSRLIKRSWLLMQGDQYTLTSQGIATIQNIVGERDFWKGENKLVEWCRSNPP